MFKAWRGRVMSAFNGFSSPKKDKKTAVNYVWISPKQDEAGSDSQYLAFLRNLENPKRNALNYPNATFNVWVDPRYFNSSCQVMLSSLSLPDNLKIRNLVEVDNYSSNPEYAVMDRSNMQPWSGYEDIYDFVDLVRFMALNKSINEPCVERAIYADFDTEDVDLHNTRTARILSRHGICFATAMNRQMTDRKISHGYIGCSKDKGAALFGELVEHLEGAYKDRNNAPAGGMGIFIMIEGGENGIAGIAFGEAVGPKQYATLSNALDFLEDKGLVKKNSSWAKVCTDVQMTPMRHGSMREARAAFFEQAHKKHI